MSKEKAIKKAGKIIQELNYRKGFEWFWDECDEDIRQEIVEEIAAIIIGEQNE